MTDPDLLPPGSRDAEIWFSLLDGAFHTGRRLADGAYRPASLPRVVAASGGRLEPMAGPGWAAVGDAAMCYDPLASHGLTVALASGRDVAEAVSPDCTARRERSTATRPASWPLSPTTRRCDSKSTGPNVGGPMPPTGGDAIDRGPTSNGTSRPKSAS